MLHDGVVVSGLQSGTECAHLLETAFSHNPTVIAVNTDAVT